MNLPYSIIFKYIGFLFFKYFWSNWRWPKFKPIDWKNVPQFWPKQIIIKKYREENGSKFTGQKQQLLKIIIDENSYNAYLINIYVKISRTWYDIVFSKMLKIILHLRPLDLKSAIQAEKGSPRFVEG